MTDHDLALKSVRLRKELLRVIVNAGAGHTGGGLSCLDILNVLYNRVLRVSPETFHRPAPRPLRAEQGPLRRGALRRAGRSRLLSRGRIWRRVCRYQSPYVGHPTRKIPGIEMNTGALGHGLPICVGMALAAKMDAAPYRVFTLLGDGELAEGSNWEAAMAAAHYQLDNLTAILDHNTLQITGHTRDVMSNEPLDEKFRAFGWTVRTVNGHDYAELTDALSQPAEPGKPTCVIANTIKGKGVSFMENVAKWHHGVPSEAELKQALS